LSAFLQPQLRQQSSFYSIRLVISIFRLHDFGLLQEEVLMVRYFARLVRITGLDLELPMRQLMSILSWLFYVSKLSSFSLKKISSDDDDDVNYDLCVAFQHFPMFSW
jgi:hypothetical protein